MEDAAQGLGASLPRRPLGTLGDAGCFSFHETKNVTCGEGGALALRGPRGWPQRAEIIREKGTNRSAFLRGEVDKYTWVAEGSSYVLSDVLAAMLDAQLDKLDRDPGRGGRAIAARYREGSPGWASAQGVRLPRRPPDRTTQPPHLPPALPRRGGAGRLPGRAAGRGHHGHVPLRAAPLVAPSAARSPPTHGALPVTERVAAALLRLPLHPLLSEADVERVIEAVTGRAA